MPGSSVQRRESFELSRPRKEYVGFMFFPSTRSGVTEEQRDGQEPRTLICGRSAHLRPADLRTSVRVLPRDGWRRTGASATAVRVKLSSFLATTALLIAASAAACSSTKN